MLCIILILSMPTATVEAAADGSGTLTLPVQAAMAGESALTLPFLYVAGVGGMSDGIIAVTLPAGWSPPSTNATDVGYSTAGMGSVSVSGQTITISNVTLTEGESLSITYGDRSGGGQGATSPVVGGESRVGAPQTGAPPRPHA
ncbi:MAG: hypothetical protein ACM3XM_13730, partial [Mycobacterium leprae]